MEKRLSAILIFCVFVIGSALSTVASADFNLVWGFEVGDQFHFRRSGSPLILTVDYYVEIDSIPFNITDLDELDFYDISYVYQNFYTIYKEDGTEMESPETFLAMPIGNWSFFEEGMFGSIFILYGSLEWINTETEWGFIGTLNSTSSLVTSTLKFSKTDGVMTLLRVVADPEEGITATFQIERRSPQADQIVGTVVIGVGIGIVALVILGIAWRYR